MFEIPLISMETMIHLAITMGGMLLVMCSAMFAVDVWRRVVRKIRKRKDDSSVLQHQN